MPNTDKDIIAVLLKSVFEKGLISEITYRNSLNRLRILDNYHYDKKENPVNGHTKNQG